MVVGFAGAPAPHPPEAHGLTGCGMDFQSWGGLSQRLQPLSQCRASGVLRAGPTGPGAEGWQ